MDAITKNKLPEKTILRLTQSAFGAGTDVLHILPLAGGFCSAVYLVETAHEKLVLKVGASPNVTVMRHETQYIPVEAEMLRLLGEKMDIPIPRLVFYDDSYSLLDAPYFFMSFLEGQSMCSCTNLSEEAANCIHYQMGIVTRKICDIPAQHFGIPRIPESYCVHNSEFVYLLFDWLLRDAQEEEIAIPYMDADALRALIRVCAPALDTVCRPVLVHTDTWAGNIMVRDGQFAGLVDFAAMYWGDPLMSHDFHDFGEQSPDFLRGYGKEGFTSSEQVRIQVYRVCQRLGMVVERGFRKYADPNLYDWVLPETEREIRRLEQMCR